MANRFLNNITINDQYTFPSSDGADGQILSTTGAADGTTELQFIDQGNIVAGEADKANSVILRVKNSTASAMSKGQVICEAVSATPPSGNLIEVALADNNGTNTMPALGILNEDLDAAGGANDEGDAIMFGKVSGINTSAFSVGDEVFVDDTPGGLTTTKPTGVKYIQKVGVVIRSDDTNGTIEVFGAGRTNDVPTPLYIDHTNQRLGIGEIDPDYKLHIDATSGGFFKITESGTDRLTLDSNNELVLTAASNWGGYFKVGKNVGANEAAIEIGEGRTANGYSRIDLIGDTTYNDYGFRIIRNNSGANTTSQLVHRGTGNFELVSNDSGDIILNPNNGNVGIGVTGPGTKLDVAGDGRFTGRVYTNTNGTDTVGILGKARADGWASRYDSNNSNFSGFYFDTNHQSIILGRDSSGNIVNYIHASGGSYFKGGNVGIGNDNPSYLLDINEDDNAVALRVTGGGGGAAMATFVRDVGSTGSQVNINAQSNFPQIQFVNTGNTFSIGGDTSGNFKISDNTSIGTNDRITIDSAGSVGIGVSGPGTKLDVAGNARFTGEINMEEDHYINLRFEVPDNNNTEQYILLCRYAANNDVNGTITMDRTSSLRHACSVDIILSAGVSALPVGGLRAIGTSGAGNPEYNLVTCYLDGVQYVALKIENPDNYYESTGAYFTGRIKSTGVKLVPKLASELTSIVDFEINTLHTFSGDAFFRDGNVEILETAAQTPADKFVVLDSGVLKYRTGSEVLSDIGGGSDSLQLIDVSEPTDTTAEWSLIKTLPATTGGTRDTLFIKVVGGAWNDEGRFEAEITLSNRDNFNYFWEVKGGDEYNINVNGSNRLRVVAYEQTDGTVDVYLYKAGYMTGYIYATFQNTGGPEIITSLGSPTTTQPSGTEVFSTHGETYSANISSVNGKVGINAAYPGKMLELRGGANEAAIRLRDTGSNVWDIQNSTLGKLDFIRGGNNTYMRIDQSGHVGVGATNPSFLLDIGDSRNDNDVFRVNGSNADVLFSGNVTAPTGGVGLWNFINTGTNATTRFYVQDANNSNDRLTFRFTGNGGSNEILSGTSSGNVGIGTTSPGQKLEVEGNIRLSKSNDVTSGFELGRDGSTLDAFIIQRENADLFFRTNNSEKMRIEAGGNVGIGTQSPNAKLDIRDGELHFTSSSLNQNPSGKIRFNEYGAGASVAGAYMEYNGASNYFSMLTNTESVNYEFLRALRGSHLLLQPSSGNVGIGTTNPNAKLHISSGTADEDCVVIIESDTDNNDEASNPRLELRQDAGAVIGRLGYRNDTNSLELINQYGEALYLGTSNSTDLTILSNGDVGIGVTSPQAKLDVDGSSTNGKSLQLRSGDTSTSTDSAQIIFSYEGNSWNSNGYAHSIRTRHNSADTFWNAIDFYVWSPSDDASALGTNRVMTIDGNGVGIGLISPAAELHVQQAYSQRTWTVHANTVAIFENNASAYLQIITGNSNEGEIWFSDTAGQASGRLRYEHSGNAMEFWTNGSQKMIINSSGDVGIGYTNPQSKLQVSGSGNETTLMVGASGTLSDKSARIFLNEGEAGVTDSKDYGFSLAYDGNSSAQYGLSSNQFGIIRHDNSAAGSAVMRINRNSDNVIFSGNVGIGMTTNPSQKLDVNGAIKSNTRIFVGYDSGVTNSISCSNWFRTNGNTGIFFASHGGGLYMTDSTYVTVYNNKAFEVNNTGTSSIRAAGDIVAYYSDERLKTNLGNITNAVDKVKKLNGFYYKNNELANSFGYTEDHLQVGVSAQEVEAIMPEVVKPAPFDLKNKENGESYSASGENYKTVKYEKLVPLLIEAIKEQQKQIDELKKQLDASTK